MPRAPTPEEADLANKLSVYTTAQSPMLAKCREVPSIKGIYAAAVKNMPSWHEFNNIRDMNKEWRAFLAEADEICKEDSEDPTR